VGAVQKGELEAAAREGDWSVESWDAYWATQQAGYTWPWVLGESLAAGGFLAGTAGLLLHGPLKAAPLVAPGQLGLVLRVDG